MSWAWATAFRSMASTARAVFSSGSRPPLSMRAQPSIAFGGVRSSWLTVARNSSLVRFEMSATCRAACSEAYRRALSSAIPARAASSSASASSGGP